jgi:hypothetical protein
VKEKKEEKLVDFPVFALRKCIQNQLKMNPSKSHLLTRLSNP